MSEPPFRVLVTGSRTWTDEALIREQFKILNGMYYGRREITLIHGTAVGVDTMAEKIAQSFGWNIERYPADWNTHGKRAGYIRNAEMVKANPDICLAFIHNESRGATMCADLAEKAGILTTRFVLTDEYYEVPVKVDGVVVGSAKMHVEEYGPNVVEAHISEDGWDSIFGGSDIILNNFSIAEEPNDDQS